MQLKRQQLNNLKASGHHLKPVVIIGDKGISPNLLAEIGRALDDHELIKIALHLNDRLARMQIASEICAQSGAVLIQKIGKMLLLYRPNPKAKFSNISK